MTRILLLLCLFAGAATGFSQTVTIDDNDLQGDQQYSWQAGTEYVLDGLVYLEAGATLTIEAGTVIRGKASPTTGDNTSALIITRGARIVAEGTAEAPIIFTAEDDNLNDPEDFLSEDRGEWGGLVVLGNATIARPGGEDGIEGIDADEARARFGGSSDDDNSGILRYISIRHGGAVLSNNNEINGLTLGGVGSGTVVDYVEVYANEDDGIELFGGTVNVTHASVAFCGDDAFDYDYGWRGKGQFWFSLQGANGAGTGRAGEHDGANPDGLAPFSNPTIYNATYIGVGQNALNGGMGGGDATDDPAFAVLLRDNSAGQYNNSIFYDFNGAAIAIEDRDDTDDGDAFARFQDRELRFVDNLFFNFGAGDQPSDLFLAVSADEMMKPGASATVVDLMTADNNRVLDPQFNGTDRSAGGSGFDPRPAPGGNAASGAVAPVDGECFEPVTYYGAFAPGNGEDNPSWLSGWTAVAAAMEVGVMTGVGEVSTAEGLLLDAPVPNPAGEVTTIQFELPRAAAVSLTVVDLLGRPVIRRTANYPAGPNRDQLNVSRLTAGTYFLLLDTGGSRLTQKLTVAR